MKINKKTSYVLMFGLIFIWGLDFIIAKIALGSVDPFTLVFIKYSFALSLMFILKRIFAKSATLDKRDIPTFIICSFIGMIVYYGTEYMAMYYIPVAIVSIILASVPTVSILSEAAFFKKPITVLMVLGTIISLFGVVFIIGADNTDLLQGKILGYALAFVAVICWNVYNFATDKLYKRYSEISIAFYQIIITLLMLAPYALTHLPQANAISLKLVGLLAFQGIISAGFGYIIYVNALKTIGITPTSLFSNLLPLSTVLLSWLLLNEKIGAMQIFGGILVITAACIVIYEKNKLTVQRSLSDIETSKQ